VNKYNAGVVILLETGDVDLKLSHQLFNDYSMFFQQDENKYGRMLILVRTLLYTIRVNCDLPNVCIVEFLGKASFRILCIFFALTSHSMTSEQLSQCISKSNALRREFNVDLQFDKKRTLRFLTCPNEFILGLLMPNKATSLRSDPTFNYVFSNDPVIPFATQSGGTSSDHLPIIADIKNQIEYRTVGSSTHWQVFYSFSKFTYTYWHVQ
jgi:hypothetical protein